MKKKDQQSTIIVALGFAVANLLYYFFHLIYFNFNDFIYFCGFILILSFGILYYVIHKHYSGLILLFSLLSFVIFLYPMIAMELFKYNSYNYKFSDDYIRLQQIVIKEEGKNRINTADLQELKDSIITYKLSRPDFVMTSTPIYFQFDATCRDLGIFCGNINNPPKPGLILSQSKLKRVFIPYDTRVPRPEVSQMRHDELIELIDKAIQYNSTQDKMLNNDFSALPPSEFFFEAILAFNSSDVEPATKIARFLNGLQILAILFLTTILINTVNQNLSVQKRKKR